MANISHKSSDLRILCATLFSNIIGKDKNFLIVGIVYAIIISLLTLAVPVSVQLLVSSVANTASGDAVIALTSVLFLILLLSSVLVATQSYVMERFERRFYARITSEFTLRLLYAERDYFNTINRHELVNRYFDVTQVQKILPTMVVRLFGTLLQTVVGCIVVATFHQTLMVFIIVFLILLWLGWRIWAYRAMYSAIILSEAKYETARHLEDVARANDYFKSAKHSEYAIVKSNALTSNYMGARISHFRHVFSQQIWLLLLYVCANAGLLGIGGNLVIAGELGLGQLIAAELILSGIFYSISRLGYTLVDLYSLVAALEEIYRVIDMPTETPSGTILLDNDQPVGITFDNVQLTVEQSSISLNFSCNAGDKVLVRNMSYNTQKAICDIMKRYVNVNAGEMLIGSHHIDDLAQQPLRDRIIILDRPTIIEATIIEYLTVDAPKATHTDIHAALEIVELTHVIDTLTHKENTSLNIIGTPLTVSETLRLKLAAAILATPHILILNEFFDIISTQRRRRIMQRLCNINGLTLIYFSQQLNMSGFSRFMAMDALSQREVASIDALLNIDAEDE